MRFDDTKEEEDNQESIIHLLFFTKTHVSHHANKYASISMLHKLPKPTKTHTKLTETWLTSVLEGKNIHFLILYEITVEVKE